MKEQIEGRPLLLIAAALIIGLSSARDLLLISLLLPVFFFCKKLSTAAFVFVAFALGWFLHPIPPVQIETETSFTGSVKIASVPKTYEAFQSCLVETEGNLYKLETTDIDVLDLGDIVVCDGQLRPFKEREEAYWTQIGASGVVRSDDIVKLKNGPILFQWGGQWRRAFMRMTAEHLPGREANIVNALCFNVDWLLDDEDRENLRRTGTTHVISASGLHIVIFTVALGWLLKRLPIPRTYQLALLVAILVIYAGAAGLRPAVIRAVLMAMIGMSAYLFQKEADWPSALGASAIVYLLFEPRAIYDIGFQLSYTTIFAIVIWVQRVAGKTRFLDEAKSVFFVSLAASIGSAPIVAYHFGSISLIGPVANVLIAGAIPWIIVPAMAVLPFALLSPVVEMVMIFPVSFCLAWIFGVLDQLGPPSWSTIDIPGFHAYWLIPIYALFLATWRFKPRPA